MGKDSKSVSTIMASTQGVTADDPDLIAKLTEIAQKVAKAQGKTTTKNNNFNIDADPMDELGCEGCQ